MDSPLSDSRDDAKDSPAEDELKNYGLLCIIFDNEKGPVIKASDPPDCLARSFQPLGQYFCPDQALAGRCVAVTLDPYILHGLPIYIPSETYDRSCFRFCIAVLVGLNTPARVLALQLAQIFYSLEIDRKFVSQSDKMQLQTTLQQVREGLNSRDGVAAVVFSAENAPLRFKERFTQPPPPEIPLCDVPLPLCNLVECQEASWDFCLRQIIPFIDGIHNIQSIATESGIIVANVILIIQHLIMFKCVTIIDMIQPTNYYRLTARFKEVWSDRKICDTVGRYITGDAGNVDLRLAQQLYVTLRSSDTVREFVAKNQAVFDTYSISTRHFITFGLMHGFLRRLHVYPNVHRSPKDEGENGYVSALLNAKPCADQVSRLADGTRSMDAIQVALNLTYEEVIGALDIPLLKFMVRR